MTPHHCIGSDGYYTFLTTGDAAGILTTRITEPLGGGMNGFKLVAKFKVQCCPDCGQRSTNDREWLHPNGLGVWLR